MQVKTVTAQVRFSKAVGENRFKTVQLSAEASVENGEDWLAAQRKLYRELAQQLRQLWKEGARNSYQANEGAAG